MGKMMPGTYSYVTKLLGNDLFLNCGLKGTHMFIKSIHFIQANIYTRSYLLFLVIGVFTFSDKHMCSCFYLDDMFIVCELECMFSSAGF